MPSSDKQTTGKTKLDWAEIVLLLKGHGFSLDEIKHMSIEQVSLYVTTIAQVEQRKGTLNMIKNYTAFHASHEYITDLARKEL